MQAGFKEKHIHSILKNQGKYKFQLFKKELDQDSFSDFFDFYYTRLFLFAVTIIKSELIAEEVVMDVFMKLWEQKLSLDKIQNIETYLFIAVRNTCLNAVKKERKFHFDMLEDAHIQLADYKSSAETSIIENEMFQFLNQAINDLPAKCKIIFKLIREDGLSRNEVSQILDISVKTVDNQVAIAVKKIAEKLNIDLTNPQKSIGLMNFLLTL